MLKRPQKEGMALGLRLRVAMKTKSQNRVSGSSHLFVCAREVDVSSQAPSDSCHVVEAPEDWDADTARLDVGIRGLDRDRVGIRLGVTKEVSHLLVCAREVDVSSQPACDGGHVEEAPEDWDADAARLDIGIRSLDRDRVGIRLKVTTGVSHLLVCAREVDVSSQAPSDGCHVEETPED
jgi:hypothetical protein